MGSSAGGVFLPNDPPPSTNQSITTPTMLITASDLIATGATGSTAAVAPTVVPAFVHANSTGVSGAGITLPAANAVPGAMYIIFNDMTGALNIYSSGATINGTTGTTAFALTATGNRMVIVECSVAGAWLARGNT